MILIAESGSTKTDWVILGADKKVSTIGYNGTFHSSEFVLNDLKHSQLVDLANQVSQVYFYGAGTSALGAKENIYDAFSKFFINAEITIERDVLASARALYSGEPIVSCILGTGSNSCLYDGKQLIDKTESYGYIIGDEGSGGQIGKQLLRSYLYGSLPKEAEDFLESKHDLSKPTVLKNVNQNANVNVYLASFAGDAKALIHLDEVREIVENSFSEFLDIHVAPYYKNENPQLGFVGSVAYHFQDILKNVCLQKGLKCTSVLQKPIDRLVQYHKNYKS